MNVDLTKVPIQKMKYENEVTFPEEWIKQAGLLGIKEAFVSFQIFPKSDSDDEIVLQCHGTLFLSDARSLEKVEYPFSFEFQEKLNEESEIFGRFFTNSQNTLDILEILWENIVLEIPISFTVSEEIPTGENKKEIDPRLAPLLELLEKEKE